MNIFKSRKILTGLAMVALILIIGTVAYIALEQIAPRNNRSGTPEDSSSASDRLIKEAGNMKDSAQSAFSKTDYETASKNFDEAAKLYEQADQPALAAETRNMQKVSDQAAIMKKEAPKPDESVSVPATPPPNTP